MSLQTTEWFYQKLAEKDSKIEELKEANIALSKAWGEMILARDKDKAFLVSMLAALRQLILDVEEAIK